MNINITSIINVSRLCCHDEQYRFGYAPYKMVLSGINIRHQLNDKIKHQLRMSLGTLTTHIGPNNYNFYTYLYRQKTK